MGEYRKAIKFFWTYFKKFKLSLLLIAVTVIIATYLQVKAPVYIGNAFTELVQWVTDFFKHQGAEKAVASFNGHIPAELPQAMASQLAKNGLPTDVSKLVDLAKHVPEKTAFFHVMWQLLIAYVFMTVAMLMYEVLFGRIVSHSTNSMRKGLFGKLERLTVSFFDRPRRRCEADERAIVERRQIQRDRQQVEEAVVAGGADADLQADHRQARDEARPPEARRQQQRERREDLNREHRRHRPVVHGRRHVMRVPAR